MGHQFFILGQADLSSAPAGVFKQVIVILVALALAAAFIYGAFFSGRKPTKIDDDPPITVRKAAKRYNHDATEQRFVRVEARLEAHDADIDQLRLERANEQGEIQRSLGRIEGRLGIPSEPTK